MIGNDIVDLEFAQLNSRWQEQRFLDKLFSREEQDFILANGKRFENIWRLWSMKESAYKIISRADVIVRFNPKVLNCFITNDTKGQVVFDNRSIATETDANLKFIQTTAFLSPNWNSKVFQFPNSDYKIQHQESYHHAVKAYSLFKKIDFEKVQIIKNETGIPHFYIEGTLQKTQLSLTHHGCFGAFAIAF